MRRSRTASSPRGTGRSYWPNVRVDIWPTIEPIAIPIIDGAIIRLSPAIIRKQLDYWTLILGPKFSKKDVAR